MRTAAFKARAALPLAVALSVTAAALAADDPRPLARLNRVETEFTAEQAHNLHALSQLLAVIELLRRDPPLALLVSADDARDAARAAMLVRAMTPELQARARAYAREASAMVRQRRLAAVASEALFLEDSARAEAAPEPAAPSAASPAPVTASGPLVAPKALARPAPGRLVRRFGDPAPGGGPASGLSWEVARAARVASPAAGVIQYVGPVKGWGTILILRLTGGYHLVLAGLGKASVAVGQSVAPGQPVGWMPDGRQSASELYLEVRQQGAPVNPARWLAE